MIAADSGTTYTKIISTQKAIPVLSEFLVEEKKDKFYYVIPSSKIREIIEKNKITINKSCGHMSNSTENEIIALANGFRKSEYDWKNSLILDLGSRDAKWVRFKNGKFKDMDWNTSCASSTGATIEMLLKFYGVNASDLIFNSEKYTVNCGIFGFEKIMDDISNGTSSDVAISKFIHGIAFNAWNFSKKPEKLYLSGGFCNNKCFVESLKQYCEVELTGRFVLCEGLLDG